MTDDLASGDQAWAQRAEGHQGSRGAPEPIQKSIDAYYAALNAEPENLETRWKLLRSLRFKGQFVLEYQKERLKLFEKGKDIAEVGRLQIERENGLTESIFDMKPAAVVSALGEQAVFAEYCFWASWCLYCKSLMPHLQSMRIEYGDDLTIYALNIRDEEMPEMFMMEHGYGFILIPKADSVMEPYGIKAVPALYVVDGQGKIRFNLYDMIFNDSSEFKALSHGKKSR